MKRILTGLQPSGELTLGSLIGGILGSVKMQDEYESFIFVPDMHAITVDQDPKMLHERIRKNVALYIACGIDPNKNVIYIQSENPYHANLSWILECNTYIEEAEAKFKDYQYGAFKGEIADTVIDYLKPIKEKYNELINSDLLDKILDDGKNKTLEIAKSKYEEVTKKVGLGR